MTVAERVAIVIAGAVAGPLVYALARIAVIAALVAVDKVERWAKRQRGPQ
jgi:hypothetical protein